MFPGLVEVEAEGLGLGGLTFEELEIELAVEFVLSLTESRLAVGVLSPLPSLGREVEGLLLEVEERLQE